MFFIFLIFFLYSISPSTQLSFIQSQCDQWSHYVVVSANPGSVYNYSSRLTSLKSFIWHYSLGKEFFDPFVEELEDLYDIIDFFLEDVNDEDLMIEESQLRTRLIDLVETIYPEFLSFFDSFSLFMKSFEDLDGCLYDLKEILFLNFLKKVKERGYCEYFLQAESSYENFLNQKIFLDLKDEVVADFVKTSQGLLDQLSTEEIFGKFNSKIQKKIPLFFVRDMAFLHKQSPNNESILDALVARYIEIIDILGYRSNEMLLDVYLMQIQKLYEWGFDFNISSAYGCLLDLAVGIVSENDYTLKLLKLLLECGADPHAPRSRLRYVSEQMAFLLHDFARSHVNAQTCGRSLEKALSQANIESARLLLQYGADPNELNANIDGSLHTVFQIYIHYLKTIEIVPENAEDLLLGLLEDFINAGGDIYYQDMKGKNIYFEIHHCFWRNDYLREQCRKRISYMPSFNWVKRLSLMGGQSAFRPPFNWVKKLSLMGEMCPFDDIEKTDVDFYDVSQGCQGKEWNRLLKFLFSLKDWVVLCEYLTSYCPSVERLGNYVPPTYLIEQLKKIVLSYHFSSFDAVETEIKYLIRHFDGHSLNYDGVVSLCLIGMKVSSSFYEQYFFSCLFKTLLEKKKADFLTPRSTAIMSFYLEGVIDLKFLAHSLSEGKKDVLFPLLLLDEKESLSVYRSLWCDNKRILLPVYNARDVTERVAHFILNRRCSERVGQKYKEGHLLYVKKVKELQNHLDQNSVCVDSLDEVLPFGLRKKFFLKKENPCINGRSLSYIYEGKEYIFKFKKEGEVFYDAGVIQDGLDRQLSPIVRQFEKVQMLKIPLSLMEKVQNDLRVQETMRNLKLSGEVCFMVVKHTDYFNYLMNSSQYSSSKEGLKCFLEGVRQNVLDYSYLATQGVFLYELAGYSHDQNRSYDHFTYLKNIDLWDQGIGAIHDLIEHLQISNLGRRGVRDLGNIFVLEEFDGGKTLCQRLKAFYQNSDQAEKNRLDNVYFSGVLIEHLWVPYVSVLAFLKENPCYLLRMTTDFFVQIIGEYIIHPFLKMHVQADHLEPFYQAVLNNVSALIAYDFQEFQLDHEVIELTYSRDGARDFPLQDFFTSLVHIITNLNIYVSEDDQGKKLFVASLFERSRLSFPHQPTLLQKKEKQFLNEIERLKKAYRFNCDQMLLEGSLEEYEILMQETYSTDLGLLLLDAVYRVFGHNNRKLEKRLMIYIQSCSLFSFIDLLCPLRGVFLEGEVLEKRQQIVVSLLKDKELQASIDWKSLSQKFDLLSSDRQEFVIETLYKIFEKKLFHLCEILFREGESCFPLGVIFWRKLPPLSQLSFVVLLLRPFFSEDLIVPIFPEILYSYVFDPDWVVSVFEGQNYSTSSYSLIVLLELFVKHKKTVLIDEILGISLDILSNEPYDELDDVFNFLFHVILIIKEGGENINFPLSLYPLFGFVDYLYERKFKKSGEKLFYRYFFNLTFYSFFFSEYCPFLSSQIFSLCHKFKEDKLFINFQSQYFLRFFLGKDSYFLYLFEKKEFIPTEFLEILENISEAIDIFKGSSKWVKIFNIKKQDFCSLKSFIAGMLQERKVSSSLLGHISESVDELKKSSKYCFLDDLQERKVSLSLSCLLSSNAA